MIDSSSIPASSNRPDETLHLETLDNTVYGSQASYVQTNEQMITTTIDNKPREVSGKSSVRNMSSDVSSKGRSRSKGKRKMISLSHKKDEPRMEYNSKVSHSLISTICSQFSFIYRKELQTHSMTNSMRRPYLRSTSPKGGRSSLHRRNASLSKRCAWLNTSNHLK